MLKGWYAIKFTKVKKQSITVYLALSLILYTKISYKVRFLKP